MYEETPNKEEIDWVVERMREIYQYDKLKDCDIDYLYNLEFGAENQVMLFENDFPSNEGLDGDVRALVYDNPNENKESITHAERMRLIFLKEEVTREIRRARGHRIELRRKHRSRILNSLSDILSSIKSLIPGLQ